MYYAKRLIIFLAIIAGSSCAHQGQEGQTYTPQGAATQGSEGGNIYYSRYSCPMDIPGTSVSAEDTRDGIALTFTTDSGDVNLLRQSVKQMVDNFTTDRSGSPTSWEESSRSGTLTIPETPSNKPGNVERGGMPGAGNTSTPDDQSGSMNNQGIQGQAHSLSYRTRFENVSNGARVYFIPRNSSDLGTLRNQVRQYSQRLSSGECPLTISMR